jgi:uncharacterized protein (DUF697 family)
MKRYLTRLYEAIINPPADSELVKAWQLAESRLPTLWLLGKTGAGKSTIVQRMTGKTAAEIGNGFMPCTSAAQAFDYPAEHPIARFMDTRGLGEVDYDPAEDLASLGKASHALVIVIRLRDPEQSAVIDAVRKIRKSSAHLKTEHALVVYTGVLEIADERDRQRAIAGQQQLLTGAWGGDIDCCAVDFPDTARADASPEYGEARLREMLAERLPEIALWLTVSGHGDAEKSNFDRLRPEVLWYAGAAAASDAVPLLGLVSVPAIQGKLLHSLARKYSISWDRKTFYEFTAALGSGFALSYATSHGARQLVKLVPGYGQVAGAAFSVTVSYAVTYALGRAACMYLYHRKTGDPLDESGLREAYKRAIRDGRSASTDMRKEHKP